MKLLFLCYDRCSTCKKAEKWLEESGVEVTRRSITEENPTIEELTKWIEKSGLPIRRFFNTSGIKYRELGLKDRVASGTTEELLELLASDGMLVKRPLLITETTVIPGFREKDYLQIL